MLTLSCAVASHTGLVREHNEDSCTSGPRLLAVADGVGGEAAGEVASALAVEALSPLRRRRLPSDPAAALRAAAENASRAVRRAVAADSELAGMATTLTALLFGPERVHVAHVGDSRAYRRRSGELVRLTRDDTYVQALVDAGRLEPEEAGAHPYRSMVTRVVRGDTVELTLRDHAVEVGDRYLVCSDGLTDVVDEDEVDEILRAAPDPRECAQTLIATALEAGAPDNVSVAVGDLTAAGRGLLARRRAL